MDLAARPVDVCELNLAVSSAGIPASPMRTIAGSYPAQAFITAANENETVGVFAKLCYKVNAVYNEYSMYIHPSHLNI
jgi:hypothetical protein